MDKELIETINLSKALIDNIDKGIIPENAYKTIFACAAPINRRLYFTENICLDSGKTAPDDSIDVLREMVNTWKNTLDHRNSGNLEERFWRLYEFFKYAETDVIIDNTKRTFLSLPEEHRELYESLPERYTFLSGKLSSKSEDYSLINEYACMMKDEVENFKWLFFRLEDNRSKLILIRLIEYWFTFNLSDLTQLHETVFDEYFDLDILPQDSDEVLVDCGAYTGDTIVKFATNYGNYKKIYAYEISSENLNSLKKNLFDYPNLIVRKCGVGKKAGKLYTTGTGAGTKMSATGTGESVPVVTLDDDIKEKVTMIKMDIEGAERDALSGSYNHIKNDKPKLLICTYHIPSDIFQIPRMIDEMRGDYKMYLRFYGRGIWPCDHVLIAI